ncbi:hypothetical protein FKM82_018813 [Ascaphus truei]
MTNAGVYDTGAILNCFSLYHPKNTTSSPSLLIIYISPSCLLPTTPTANFYRLPNPRSSVVVDLQFNLFL